MSGIRVVKSFANEDLEKEKFAERNQRFLHIKRGMYHNMAGFHSVTRLFDGVMYIVVVILGALFMINGKIGPEDLVAYLLYVQTLLTSIRRFVEFSEQLQRGITGFERFDDDAGSTIAQGGKNTAGMEMADTESAENVFPVNIAFFEL